MRKKKGRKIVSILAVTIMTVSVIFGALASGSSPAYAAEFSSDTSSATDWVNYLEDKDGNLSTETVGRIWTDKTVSKDQITFEGSDNGILQINKQKDSDFLVALSAMSSTSNIMTKTDKPLDIVILMDVSGSMDNGFTSESEYIEVYDNGSIFGGITKLKSYYCKIDETNQYQEVSYYFLSRSWGYNDDNGRFIPVEPKTSANDNTAGRTQFYEIRTTSLTRMDSLKKTVNAFIDETAKQNSKISDASKHHKISLVKFAGDKSNKVGITYDRNDYNHTQIVCHLTDNDAELKNNMDKIKAAGGTRAHYGFDKVTEELNPEEKHTRDYAQKVVIFFTDGEPNNGSGFVDDVANETINSSKALKEKGVLVYSVGVFDNADATDTKNKFNKYMHGVSSNYPNAISYNNLGNRASDSDFYKVAKTDAELGKIFTDIAGEIQKSAQGAPTQIGDGYDSTKSGYITFKDQLGKYVKCDGFSDIVFAGKQFKNPSVSSENDKDGNTVTTYTFSGTGNNNLYPNGDLADIIIKVTSYKELSKGDYVEVKVPASLIPVRNFDISEGKMTVTETHPIRILYNASVKDGVVEDLKDENGKVIKPALVKNPDTEFNKYLRDSKNKTQDGKVKFFSNMWNGGDNGDTTATFTPAVSNSFYRFTDDAQLFKKTATGKEPVTSIGSIHTSSTDEYFFEKTYYTAAVNGGEATVKTEPSYIRITDTSNLNEWMVERNGKVFIKSGTQRLLRIDDFTNTEKEKNETNTAKYVINPVWDSNRNDIIAYLGNNGVATAQVGGVLSVSKTAELAEGMTGPVDSEGKSTLDEQEFTFEISAIGTADGKYTSVIYKTGADGTETKGEYNAVTFKDGKTTVTLKNKERIEIYGIKSGVDYIVTETNQPEGFKQIIPADNKPATGKISDVVSKAEFVNEYKAEPPTEITSKNLGLCGNKTLDGRTFKDGDTFKFMVRASNLAPNSPLPSNRIVTVNGKDYVGKNTAPIDFGKFTFSKPGEYRYSITEYLPKGTTEDPMLPSVTYDETAYRLIVNVTDDGKGNLSIKGYRIDKRASAESAIWDKVYESTNGAAADKGYINFTNKYKLNTQKVSILGLKTLTGKSLGDYGDMQFGFKVEAKGARNAGTNDEFTEEKDQPMPLKNSTQHGNYIYKNSTTGNIIIPEIAFATKNIGKEYKYVISELQPVDKDGKPLKGATQVGDKWNYKGVTFDNSTAEIIIKVGTKSSTDGDHELEITIISNDAKDVKDTHFYFTFDNAYNANLDPNMAVSLNGTKNITGRSFVSGDEFKFKVDPQDGAPNPENTVATVNPTSGEKADFDFGKIEFNTSHMAGAVKQTDGTYKKDFTYKITEVEGTKPGIKYDNVPVIATVTVTDNGEGKLSSTVKYTKAGKDVTNAQFTNEYKSEFIFGKAGGLDVTKTLNGRDMRKTDAFGFTIKGITANGVSADEANKKLAESDKSFATNDVAKTGEAYVMNKLSGMKFTQVDTGKTYSYEVSENTGNVAGVTYDKSKYEIAIKVFDDLNGKMHTVTTVTKTHDEKGNAIDRPEPQIYDSSKSEKPEVAFVNTYKARPVAFDTAEAEFGKILEGREVQDTDKFTFAVDKVSFNGVTDAEALKKMPSPEKPSVTLTGSEIKNQFSFGEIEFTEPGTYEYSVKEIVPEDKDKIPGITYCDEEHKVIVKVTDDGNGTLAKEVIQYGNNFKNVYDAEDVPVDTNTAGTEGKGLFTKEVTGRPWADDEKFIFKLTAKDGAPMPTDVDGKEVNSVEVTKPENGKMVDFGFGTIKFDKAGKYVYEVKEVAPVNGAPGMTYDGHTATLTITVKDNYETGKLVAENPVVTEGTFDNTYKAASVTLDPANSGAQFTKKLTGREWKNGETFSFTISPKSLGDKVDKETLDKMPMPKKNTVEVSKPANGNETTFDFGQIEFAKAGIYKYNVKENKGTANGVTYDNHTAVMVVTVKDNVQTGKLEASVSFEGADQDYKPNEFINTYKADPIPVTPDGGDDGKGPKYSFTKVLNGRDSLKDEEFSFTLEAVTAGAPMPNNVTATVKDLKNGVAKDFGFGIMTFDKAGTFEYVVKENVPAPNPKDGLTYDAHSAKLKIIVTDNSDLGKLEAKVEVTDKTFTNNYESKPVDFDTNDVDGKALFTKEVAGRSWKSGETFKFTISKDSVNGETSGEAFDKMPMPEVENVAVTTPADGSNLAKFGFGTIKFNKVGVYKYTITEEKAGQTVNGLTYDKDSAELTITVTDDNKGNLLVSHALTKDKFTNVYKAGTGTFDPTKAQTQFTKQLTGREWKDSDKFRFKITPKNGAPAPAVSEVEVTKPEKGDKVNFNFGNIVFDAEGTYTYDVVEVIPADADKIKGVTYDEHHAKMTVEVTDNKDGELVATATFDKPDFVNKYTAAPVDYNTEGTDATAKFVKVLTGRPWLGSDSFSFNIKANDKAPMPVDADGKEIKKATVTKPENGNKVNFDFGTISFEKAGTYSYTVTEVKPEASEMIPGITYDEHEATLTIKVKDNKDGNLEIESVKLENGTFTNTYRAGSVDVTPTDANAPLTKKLTGRDWKTQDNFSFTIGKLSVDEKTEGEAFDKMPMPNATQVTVAKPEKGNEATFAFGNIQFTKEGVYKYKVVENNAGQKIDGLTYSNNVATITVNVTDKNFDGALEAEVSIDSPEFENIYKADPIPVDTDKYGAAKTGLFTKKLIGRDSKAEETFNFTLTPVTEKAPMPINSAKSVKDLKNGEAQNFGFGVIEFDKAGTYVYNVVEENAGKTIDGLTYASNTAKMTITVTDKEDGTFSTDVKVENALFENKYKAEVDFGKIGANFNITKSLSGRDMIQDQFSFEVKALDAESEKALNIPVAGETVKSPAANMDDDVIVKVIDNLKFTEKDSNKTYGFTVKESGKAPAGYVYDETMYTIKIKIDDLADGKLKATAKVLAGEKLAGEYTWTPDSKDVKPVVLSFENTYSADNNNAPAVVEANKTLNGRHLKAEEFNFQIKDAKGTVVREAKNEANGTVNFGEGFTYNINDLNEMVKNNLATQKVEDGKNIFTIPYTAEEVGNMPAGVTMTAGNFSFNIKVTDNGDGTLAADVVYPEGGIRFVNTYATGTDGNNEVPLKVIGNKVISAEDGLVPPAIDGKFSFTMTGDENAPLPEKATVTNDGAGQITFGNIKYTLDMLKDVEPAEDGSRTRTFNYTVTESGLVPGITNDANTTRTFSVTLKDDGVGNLTATASDSARFTFTNTYSVVTTDPTSITDQIKISKKLTGRDLVAEEFKFELVDSENKVVATGTNDAKGKIVFTPMTYDRPGKFTYTVREVANKEYDGVDYDETLFTVNTEVKDNSDGTLSVTHSVDGAEVVFNNKYSTGKTSVVIGAAKKFIGSDLKAGQFKFELKDEDGKLVSAAVNDKDGNIIFDEITYDKEGTYKYTISEVNSGDKNVKFDDTVFGVTVEVTDDKKGNLVAKAETDGADGVVFVNTYEKPQEPQTPPQSDDGAKTGDDTPINALVIFMGAAILLMGTLIERRKTN